MRKILVVATVHLLGALVASLALALPGAWLPGPAPGADYPESGSQGGGDTGNGTGNSNDEAQPVALESVYRSDYPSLGFQELTFLVIQDEATWKNLWAGTPPGLEPPQVDFATLTVLVALMGQQPTLGYSINITEVVLGSDGTYTVSVLLVSPGPTCSVGMALTDPVHMASIPKADGPFEFVTEAEVESCG